MSSQQQDLIYFSNGSLLFNDEFLGSSVHIISYHDGTAPMWLTTTLVENCLIGTANLVNRELQASERDCSVVYVSFIHSLDDFEKACRKQVVDFSSLSLFKFLDYSQSLFTTELIATKDARSQVAILFEQIVCATNSLETSKAVVFLDSPEILLAATNLPVSDLLSGIRKLNRLATVVPIINVHLSIVDMKTNVPEDPAYRISDFYVKLFHTSSLNVSLQPLSTGKAKDITGSLTVTKGAIPTNVDIAEREYFFQVTKDATAKLYFR